MIENHRSELVWKLFMANPEIAPEPDAIGSTQYRTVPWLAKTCARASAWFLPLALIVACSGPYVSPQPDSAPAPAAPRWFKGNLHTHSLWSDGDDFPEMIADWYKRNEYHFLAISDHNRMQEGQRWLETKPAGHSAGTPHEHGGDEVLQKYLRRFGADWVERREIDGKKQVRLKPLSEYRALLEEPGRFLMIPSEEISTAWKRPKTATEPERGGPIHVNATNLREPIAPPEGESALEVMQKSVDAVLAQREATGQPMFPHINHPNFGWAVTAEELMQVTGERFFEVYNGHPLVHNRGDAAHLDTDRMWDVILTRRLAELGLEAMYGVAVDDAHHYHTLGIARSNAGRGWIMVRARHLTPESVIHAMEAGDFYATTGVVLNDVRRDVGRLAIEIAAEPGVTYVTRFIGTRRGYDPSSEIIADAVGEPGRTVPHRRYSAEIGAVLAEMKGAAAAYTLKGDEIYVRAKIVSSKSKVNPSAPDELETAWTQPLVNTAK